MTDNLKHLNPWHPMSDPVDIKHIGKLIEELGELTSALARCLIQGIDEVQPETQKPNRVWTEDEMADVLVGLELATVRFGLTPDPVRMEKKRAHLSAWHKMA